MNYIGKVKYTASVEPWAGNVLNEGEIYKVTDLSSRGFINIELNISPKSYYSDITEHFEIVEDIDDKLSELFKK